MSTTTLSLPNDQLQSFGIALLRAVLGIVFTAHGAQKLFVFGIEGVTAGFEGAGVPLATVAGPAVALLEFVGGIALVLGVFTRLVSAALALTMVGAMLFVHLPAGFFMPNGVEFALSLFAATTALALLGPGELSLDAVLARRRRGRRDFGV